MKNRLRLNHPLYIYAFYAFLPVVFLCSCNCGGPLEIQSSQFCPDYDAASDACNDHGFQSDSASDHLTVEFTVSDDHKIGTWKEWNYFIYFEAPITVGYLVRWNREASLEERSELRKDLHCSYLIQHPTSGMEVRGELEGKRLEKNGVWCFDYLGTLLAVLQKEEGILQNRPERDYFPVKLTLMLESSKKHLRTEVSRSILVIWR